MHQITVAKVTLQPDGVTPQITLSLKPTLRVLASQGVDLIIVILDMENHRDCPGQRASEIENSITSQLAVTCQISVVMKNKAFENWLIADVAALQACRKRFTVSEGTLAKIRANADSCNAHALLKASCADRSYHKVKDAILIFSRATSTGIASNSRSFRKLCRLLGHPHQYRTQSRL